VTRKRPERVKSQWADLRAATDWYMAMCQERGVPREEALQAWEDLSIAARIRRHKEYQREHTSIDGMEVDEALL